jgi:hypothetical protein
VVRVSCFRANDDKKGKQSNDGQTLRVKQKWKKQFPLHMSGSSLGHRTRHGSSTFHTRSATIPLSNFLFCSMVDPIQGLLHTKQVLYLWATPPALIKS